MSRLRSVLGPLIDRAALALAAALDIRDGDSYAERIHDANRVHYSDPR